MVSKKDHSPLTEADIASHDLIVKSLHHITPGIPILSEESADISFSTRASWTHYWLVDPLDGTKEFIKQNGEFTVNIALIEEQVPILGVIVIPVTGVAYAAARNLGALRHDGNSVKALNVRQPATKPWRVAVSRSHINQTTKTFIRNLVSSEPVSIGSSLKFCLLVEGQADIYPRFSPTSEWDTAAAQCIIEEAGGAITDVELKPLRYNTKNSFINPYFLAFGDGSINWRQFVPSTS